MAKKQSGSRWVWVFLFIIIGSFAGFVYFLDQKIGSKATPGPAEVTQPKNDKPRIDFYSILPDRKVDIPISEEDRQAIESPSINKSATEEVILQAGSFQSMTDADSRKAQLAFFGLEAKITSAVVNNDTWYRVVLGPFDSNSGLSRAQNLLLENKIPYLQKSAKP
jgi:cell division protein FtsN